ncbi:MAG: tetratricopeptide repeat protein [Planctomycetes bacterium]|nr:tetratricopeptide repeat protein [Planctomycetota bacterium]
MNGARSHVERLVRRVAGVVLLLAILAYGTALAGEFVFDDVHSVAANTAVQAIANVPTFWVDPDAFSIGSGKMYRPALLTSFAVNWWLCAGPMSLKAGNVLLHAATAGLAFLWLWRLSRRVLVAGLAAAWFAVHPLASEAVNLVSARSELLAAFGILVTLHAHVGWQRGTGGFAALAGMVLGTVLACGSKETGVVLPVLVVAQTWCMRHGAWDRTQGRRLAQGLAPVVAVVLGYLVARKLLLGQATVQLLGRAGDDPASGHGRSLAMQLATMGTELPHVLGQILLPARLSFDPAVTFRTSFGDPLVWLGWGSMLGVTLWATWPRPGARLRRLGVAFAWLVAAPWIVVPLNMPLAEHRYYGPMLGCSAVLVGVLPRVAPFARRLLPRRAWLAVAAVVAVLAAVHSGTRSWLYRDERALWAAELEQHPDSFRAWWGLGAARLRNHDYTGAVAPLAKGHALYPLHYDAHRNFAEALVSVPDDDATADPERAVAVCHDLLAKGTDKPWARTLLAQAELQLGRMRRDPAAFERAERVALSCLDVAAPKGYVYWLAAKARRGLDDLPGALQHLDAGIARGLGTTSVRLERAAVLRDLGRLDEARAELARVQREAPLDPAVMQAVQQFAAPGR